MSTFAITTPISSLRFQMKQTSQGGSVFVKNAVVAYVLTASSFSKITDADYPTSTVPGLVYLDDYMFVQKITGEIVNSANRDVSSWNALSFITPEKEPSNAVAIAKSLNYLVAFKEWDTEFFEDAGIASPASPLAPTESAYLKLGCATAESIVEFDGGIVFMSKRDQLQRSREIHVLNGLTPKKISNENVEVLINADGLTTTYACYLATAGHQLYSLTLKETSTTIVYDFNNGFWYEWSFLTAKTSTAVTGLTASGLTATATQSSHGFADGDPVTIGGASQGAYNGTFAISLVDANTYTYPVTSSPVSPATGTITSVAYTESYFPAVNYATYQNLDLVLHETNGIIYSLDPNSFQDNGVPINVHIRLSSWDGGNARIKTISRLRAIGDRVDADLLVRYSDNDQSSYSAYRRMDLSQESAQLTRLGSTRRRVYELRHTDNTALRLQEIEQDEKQGR